MLKQTVSEYDFRDWFLSSDTYKHNFSYEGLSALFDYLEQLSDDIGEDLDFDPVAIACDYSENDWESIADNYSIDTSDCEDDDEAIEAVEEYLLYNAGCYIDLGNGRFIYQAF